MGMLGQDLRVRAQFITTGIADQYDAIKLTVLNRTDGLVDTLVLGLRELLELMRDRFLDEMDADYRGSLNHALGQYSDKKELAQQEKVWYDTSTDTKNGSFPSVQ